MKELIYDIYRMKVSPYTNLPLSKYTMDCKNSYTIILDPITIKEQLTADDIFDILSKIPDEDQILLGVSHPENFIYKNLPVPPVCIRPSLRGDKFSIGFCRK